MKKTLLAISLLCTPLIADEEPIFAGTLLAYYPTNAPVGRFFFQPYFIASRNYGFYNQDWHLERRKSAYQVHSLTLLQTGIIDQYLDVNVYLNAFYGRAGNRSTLAYGDTQLLLGSQLLENVRDSWTPDLRLLLSEMFPTGRYQKLNPHKRASDATGAGSYETTLILAARKIFYTLLGNPSNITINAYYTFNTKTDVEGISVYGGGVNTKGVVHPGNALDIDLAFEYCITRHFAFGLDIFYETMNKSAFTSKRKEAPPAGLPSSTTFQLAPCLEYNPSAEFSIVAGSWFSVGGRNSAAFVNASFTFFYEF